MGTLRYIGRIAVAATYGLLLAAIPLLTIVKTNGQTEVGALSGMFAGSALVISLAAVGSVVLVGLLFSTFFGTANRMGHEIEVGSARSDAITRLNKRLLSGEINDYEYRRQLSMLGQPGSR